MEESLEGGTGGAGGVETRRNGIINIADDDERIRGRRTRRGRSTRRGKRRSRKG